MIFNILGPLFPLTLILILKFTLKSFSNVFSKKMWVSKLSYIIYINYKLYA